MAASTANKSVQQELVHLQAPGDTTVLKRFFRHNFLFFVIYRKE